METELTAQELDEIAAAVAYTPKLAWSISDHTPDQTLMLDFYGNMRDPEQRRPWNILVRNLRAVVALARDGLRWRNEAKIVGFIGADGSLAYEWHFPATDEEVAEALIEEHNQKGNDQP